LAGPKEETVGRTGALSKDGGNGNALKVQRDKEFAFLRQKHL
jgi:hypothetical protein